MSYDGIIMEFLVIFCLKVFYCRPRKIMLTKGIEFYAHKNNKINRKKCIIGCNHHPTGRSAMNIKTIIIVLLAASNFSIAQFPTCSDMSSCEEAYEYLQRGYSKLDRDRDGVPCESICGQN
jgi:hypothetical protein